MEMQYVLKLLGAYQERLLATINHGWWTLPAKEVEDCEDEDNVLALCHIVDTNLLVVKEIALLEKDMGIKSTYLIPNYIAQVDTIETIAFLMSLEHEVGVSLELLMPFMTEYEHPHDTLRKSIEPFKGLGIRPKAIHFPPSPMTTLTNIENSDYFSDFGVENTMRIISNTEINSNRMFRVGVHPLREYGFEYVINQIPFIHTYDNQFEQIQPEDTGRSVLYLNLAKWEVS